MRNVQIIDGAENCVYDVFSVSDEDFELVFPNGTNVAFIEEIYENATITKDDLDEIFARIWSSRIEKHKVNGINGILFFELEHKKAYYPTRKDEEAINPNGSKLR